jgi:hypothetical protein
LRQAALIRDQIFASDAVRSPIKHELGGFIIEVSILLSHSRLVSLILHYRKTLDRSHAIANGAQIDASIPMHVVLKKVILF